MRMAALLAAGLAAAPAMAQPKPYAPLEVAYDRAVEADAGLAPAIETLRKAVAERNFAEIYASLAPNFTAIECEGDPTKPCAPNVKAYVRSDAKLKPPQRLRQALCCRDIAPARISETLRQESVLGLVGGALEEEGAGSPPFAPGLACLPAWPKFDLGKAAAIALAADVDKENLRVTTRELVMLGQPKNDAPELARLPPGQIAPLVTDLPDSLPDGWTAIALPQGGVAYTRMLGLADLTPSGVCLAKDAGGAWRISLTIQRRS